MNKAMGNVLKRATGSSWTDSLHWTGKLFDHALKLTLNKTFENFINTQKDPAYHQEILFQNLLKKLKGTAIYQDLGLKKFKNYREFIKGIIPRGYDFYHPYIKRIMNGESGVLFHGEPEVYLSSSGTTGSIKYIPYNREMLKNIQSFQTKIYAILTYYYPHFNLWDNKLFLGNLGSMEDINSVPVRYISGFMRTRTPFVFRSSTFPSLEALETEDWDYKVYQIYSEVIANNITFLGGMPAALTNLLTDILKMSGKSNINEIWPNLSAIVYSGTPIDIYRPMIEKITANPLLYLGAYVATETPMGIESLPNYKKTESMFFTFDDILFSFVEKDSTPDNTNITNITNIGGTVLSVNELQKGKEYYVNISSPNGLLQYTMKDVVQVTDVAPYLRFRVLGRSNTAIDVACEKVTDAQLNEAILNFEKNSGMHVEHFFVYPHKENGRVGYHWILISDLEYPENVNIEKLAQEIDNSLRDSSYLYNLLRDAGSLGRSSVEIKPCFIIQKYFKANSHRGNFKFKKAFHSVEEFKVFSDHNLLI